jgi:arylsulfatase A-like enzyme
MTVPSWFGSRRPRSLAAPLWLLLALALPSCSGPEAVVYDLAERLPVAELWSSRDVILFGTPSAQPHQVSGFYPGARPGDDPFVWGREEAWVSLTWKDVSPRSAILDLAPFAGVGEQTAEIWLNETLLDELHLRPGRHRYGLEFPEQAQRVGENRLRFLFGSSASPAQTDPGSDDQRYLAAAFYGLTVGQAGDPGLDDLLGRGAPPPFSVAGLEAVPTLVQVGPSVVRYAIRVPEDAELRFTPSAHPVARTSAASVAFRVTLELESQPEREIWARVLEPQDSEGLPVSLKLPAAPGTICRLGLHVGGTPPARHAWGLWKAPRVMGRSGSGRLEGEAYSVAERRTAEGLRRSLDGANVLLVFLDAARAEQVGAYGYERATTPEIDRIAREGVVFERAYTPAVYTLAAMSSVWTSQYPDRHHENVAHANELPAGSPTVVEALAARGFHTAGFVANAMAGRAKGFERGFEEFHEVFGFFPEELGSRAGVFRRVLPGWLGDRGGQRFFAYLHFREPHFPYDPPPPFPSLFGPDAPLSRAQRRVKDWYIDVNQGRVEPSEEEIAHLVRLYDANLAYADREIGALYRALEETGLLESTVLIIASDHGEQLYERGYISHSAQVLEQSIRIPLIVRFPQSTGISGRRVDGLVDLLDLAPSLLDIFGFPDDDPARSEMQGRSLLPVVSGAPGKRAILSRTVWERPVYALRDQRYKLIHDTRTGESELYDLERDRGEARDLAGREPVRLAYYRQGLQDGVGRLQPGEAGSGRGAELTPEQCENLKSLGYLASTVECGGE